MPTCTHANVERGPGHVQLKYLTYVGRFLRTQKPEAFTVLGVSQELALCPG